MNINTLTPILRKIALAFVFVIFITAYSKAQPPLVPASNIHFSDISSSTINVLWSRGDGSACVVFATDAPSPLPPSVLDFYSYAPDSQYGFGSFTPEGYFCVYNGAGTNVTVTNLNEDVTYTFFVVEYNGMGGSESYFVATIPSNNQTTPRSSLTDIYTNSVDCSSSITFTDLGGIDNTYNADDHYGTQFQSTDGVSRINIKFQDFYIDNDVMIIYDGEDQYAEIIGSYTGGELINQEIVSSGASLFVEFHSNGGEPYAGWLANVNTINTSETLPYEVLQCGTTHNYTFPSTGGYYADNLDFIKSFNLASAGNSINITTNNLHLGAGDNLYVYDGEYNECYPTMNLVANLSAGSFPQDFTINNGFVTFHFVSNADGDTGFGWDMDFSCTEQMFIYCDEVNPSNVSYPAGQPYQTNVQIGKLLAVQDASNPGIELNFRVFDIGDGELTIYDGNSTTAPVLGVYNSSNIPAYVLSTSPVVLLSLQTGSMVATGFQADVKCNKTNVEVKPGVTQTFAKQFYASNYELIQIYSRPTYSNGQLKVTFSNEFYIADDILKIYDGNSITAPLIGTYTGYVVPPTFISTNGALTFQFVSNNDNNGVGWNASIILVEDKPIEVNCVVGKTNLFFPVSNPKNSEFIHTNEVITYKTTDNAYNLKVTFPTFNIGSNVLEVYDGYSTTSPLIGTYTGFYNGLTLTSSVGNALTFHYVNNEGANPLYDWLGEFSCEQKPVPEVVCGLEYSFNYPTDWDGAKVYGDNQNYILTLKSSDPTKVLKVSFTDFNLEKNFDYLNIFDGSTTASKRLAGYSGTTLPVDVYSTSQYITFQFISDGSVTFTGLRSLVTCSDAGGVAVNFDYEVVCGSTQSINSVYSGIFQDMNHHTVFKSSDPVKTLQVTFKNFNMNPVRDVSFMIYDENGVSNVVKVDNYFPFTVKMTGQYVTISSTSGALINSGDINFSYEVECAEIIPESELQALRDLYNYTDGANWNNTWDMNASPDTWYGVKIEYGHVTRIELDNNNLRGGLPTTLSSLIYLEYLSLQNNSLGGVIPDVWGSTLHVDLSGNEFNSVSNGTYTNTSFIDLSYNKIKQTIPNFVDPSNLQIVNFSNNDFFGSFDVISEWGTGLTEVNLSNNNLSGSISRDISNLENLKELYLDNNNITGSIPFSLGNLSNLQLLYLQNNSITGEIPTNFSQLLNLIEADFSNNNFSTTFPTQLVQLTKLEYLNLSSNNFYGQLPNSIGNFPTLIELNLSNNQFSGNVPTALGLLKTLQNLDLSNNQFSGNFESNFDLKNIRNLDISGNYFSGNFPVPFLLFSNIKNLDISDNDFSGSIPSSIQNLSKLNTLDISSNYFSGDLSSVITLILQLSGLNIADNYFTSLPYFANNVYAGKLNFLNVSDNKLLFNSLSNNLALDFELTYTPQAPLNSAETIVANEETVVILTVEMCGEGTNYEWYRNGSSLGVYTSNVFLIENYTDALAGIYSCVATHPSVPGLELERYPITVETYQAPLLEIDRYALEILYVATAGDTWINSWGLDGDLSTLDGDPTTWYGVTISKSGRVTKLNLAANNLFGMLPDEIGWLTGLVELNLSANFLGITLTNEIQNLTNLKELNISRNVFEGLIPDGINSLTKLTRLDFSSNSFSGTLPYMGDLIELNYLNMSNNKLEALPASLFDLYKIRDIYLNNNYLTGSIPSTIANLLYLTNLYLNNNQLSGSIPIELFSSYNLLDVNLANNAFEGAIPYTIGNMKQLKFLNLSFNKLNGDFPSQISDLYEARTINLRNNQLTGSIPTAMGYLWLLEKLDIRNNKMTGEITLASQIDMIRASKLKELYLSGNQFIGALPANFYMLEPLEVLDLKNNMLEDVAGLRDLSSFKYMSELTLEGNKLQFDDLQPIPTVKMTYIPQQNVQTAQTLTIQDKQQMTLTAEVDGTGNIYQWYKGGQKIGTASTSNTYTITAATVADEGVYYCEVTNDAIPGLVIKREPLTLQFVLGGPVAVYPADLIALHALYVTTTGSNWKNNDNWLDESVSVDTWYGVTLSDAPMITENGVDYYRVVSINLSNNSLNGTLPGEIENLTELKDLNLYINRISGDLLSGLGKLTNLTTLNLGGNLLSGTVPVDFKYLTKLTELNLTSNFLEGTFPAMLLEMPTLQSINLSFNGFDGTFSLLTTNLPALTYLNISDNKFSGTFPSEINNLSTLKKLEIQNNVFFGDFPAINGLQSVEYVDISFNDFSSFPSLAMLPYIQTLTVKNNRLEFDDLEPNVSIVNFSYSPQQMVYSPQEVIVYEGLSYTIKSEVGGADNNYYWYKNGMEVPGANQPSYTITGATQFESGEYRCFILSNIVQGLMLERYTVGVTVSKDSLALVALYNATKGIAWAKNNNWLTQNIDTWYGVTVERGKVTKVNLNSNNLDGTLPYEIGYLTNLNTLNLYENNLSGTLPIAIGWLQNLEILNVRNNSLSGTLPDDLYNLGKITSLNLSKNQFEGAISSNIVLLNSAIVLDFSNNNFLNMNEITLTPSNSLPNLQLLSVANNYLTFGDLEYNMNKFSGFSYVPQKMVDEQQTITASEFSSISLSVYVDGSKNMYTWSKGNSVIGTPSTDNSLVFSKVQLADAGSYHCTITNSLVPDLFLTYAPIKLEVTPTQLPMQSHDQDILLKLYYSADGANWNYMWNPAQVDVYNWHGVTLNHEGYVTHIDLTGNNLVGTIAPELSQLQYLESFVVADNVLSGELPISIGSMPKLRTLDISNNKLNVIGQLPASLTLDRLKVSSNYLNYNSLEINASIPNIEYYPQKTLVETIMIQGGQSLTITFDAGGYNTFYEWKKGTNSLYDFDNVLIINDADLTNEGQYTCVAKNGLVMQSGFKLEKIFNIDVIEAPVKEADKAALIALYNATNGANWNMNWNLSEDVRTWYGVVVDIKGQVVEINLSGNNLSGQLPAELGNLTMLTSLNLGNNNITGSVPNELASLSNLQTLILKNNLITSLPDIRFVKLNQLDVSSNDLAFNSLATHIGIENFLYVPQNLHIYTFSIQGGDNLTLNVPGFQAYNYYEWYQNDNYLFNEESKYDIIDAKQEDNGIFSCVVTNTFVPTLELEYRFIVQVTQRDIVIDDYNALIALYNATNGQNWIYTWDLSRPVKEWKGVELDYSGKVTKIDLSNNMLKGYLPTEIGNLSRLHCLRLSNNLIGGTIPNSIGNLIQLDTLMLNKNMLSGAIPDEINNLEFLYVLYLNNNELTTLPATISGLYNLEKLYLNNNRFETSIPPSYFDYLDWIKVIQLANNKFFGELPQFATLYGSALEELYVQNNNFGLNTMVRTIPNSIFDLWNLKIFSAYNNSLSGEISSDIVNMHNLRELRLSNNKFTGNLPQNMDNLRDLEILELNQNLLNGVIPMSVGLMSNVRILDLSDNNFSGDMPDLVNLTSVEEIVLNNNNLTGIPPFSLDYLSKLDIQNNFMEFDDIEKLSSVFNVDFTYTPQGDINNAYTETVDNNTSFLIETIAHSLYPLNYQWHRNDQPVGTNSPIYSVEFALAEHQGVYTCVVTSVNSDMKLVLNRSDVTINVNIIPIPINDADYNALLKLYAATNGAGWTNKLGWENPSKDSKDWYGVTFDKGRVIAIELSANKLTGNLPPEIGDFTALQKLVLSNNQIEGSLPAEIGKLSTLQILDLSWNAFQNQIPAEIGNMSSLTVLNLANNRFAGTLTPEIGKITTLKIIDLNSNQLNGEIPAEIGSLLALTNLNLSYNDLSGSVPSSMANLVHLVNLEMIDNQLSGEFPKIDNLKKLLIMNIESNDFEGLPNLSMLLIQKLTVKNNRLTFEDLEPNIKIPTLDYTPQHSIGLPKSIVVNYGANWELKTVVGGKSNVYNWKLNTTDIAGAVASNYIITKADDTDEGTYVCLITNPLLPLLILHTEPIDITVSRDSIALAALYRHTNGNSWTNNSNWLTGNLDTWYGLNVIDHRVVSVKLPSNNLVGVIPDSIGYLEEVEEINLLGNSLNNSIPASIGELKKLNILNLRNNKLSGELPDNIFNLASLTSLNLSNNLLSGTIKKELSNLKNAIVLDLSYNYFRDLDVLDVSKLTKLQLLSVSYNKLTFEDIVPNQQNLAGFNFNPQRKFNLELVLLKNKGESYILQIDSVGGNNLVYQWYKDGKLFGDVQSVYSFEVNNLSVTHEGDYTCRVYWKNATNDVVYDFFIERSIIRLNVQRELPMPIVKVNNPYCFGDKQVTLSVTQTEDDNGIDIIWYRDKELTDSISSGFTFLYTMPAEIDTIYALRADGIKKGESAEVIIKLRPDIIRADNKLIATFVEGATYTWYYNNARLDITVNSIDLNGNYGNYRVSLVNGGCTSSSPEYIVTVGGISTAVAENLQRVDMVKVYPNPAQNVVNVQFTDFTNQSVSIEIMDISGKQLQRVISNTENTSIDISSLARGVYFLRIATEGKLQTYKLIKVD